MVYREGIMIYTGLLIEMTYKDRLELLAKAEKENI